MRNPPTANTGDSPPSGLAAPQSPPASALAVSELRYRRLFETAKDGILILDAESGMVTDANPFLLAMLGYSYEAVAGKAIWELGFLKDAIASRDKFLELQQQEYVRYENLPLETADGRRRDVEFVSNVYLVGEQRVIQCNIRDITQRRQAEARQVLATQVLAILNRHTDTPSIVADILKQIKGSTGIQAVGIRLRQGDDYPYVAQDGFSCDFLDAENALTMPGAEGGVQRNTDGSTYLECTCGLVVSGKIGPLNPLFTAGGSFWTNDASPLLDLPADQDPRLHPRNRCIREGFRSIALVALRLGAEIIGVLQLNDRRPNRFTLEMVQFLEGLGASIAVALMRQRSEQALHEKSAFLETLLQTIPVPVFHKDAAGLYTGFNRAFGAFYGKGRTELLGKSVFDVAPPELARIYHAKDLELLQSGGVQVYDAQMQDAHGELHNVVYHKAVLRDAAGQIEGLIGVVLDITERVRAEEAHARLATAVEQSAEAIEITDIEGAILYANPAFERITGYSRAEIIGRNPRLLKSGRQDAGFYRRMWAVLGRGEVWSGHLTNRRKDGTLYEEEASISPVRDAAGKVINYVAVKRDVTHETELEQQLRQAQKMEAVGRLAGGVAHDFNNLLMGIMNYVELCCDQIGTGHPVREYLDEIMRDAQRSAEITRQLLAFARKQIIAPRVLDLNDAVVGMLKLLQRLIGEDIALVWAPGAALRRVKLDPSQLDQILANLCINARDAIGGVGKLTLETGNIAIDAAYGSRHADALPGAYVFLAVSDDGCGMDAGTLAQVFEPFFTTKGVGKGTGLGLATVYGIVKQNNGFIQGTSAPGQGTTFTIYLPEAAPEAAASAAGSPGAVPRGQGETVLLVEDERSLRQTCGMFLKALGYTVLMAETPAEALLLAARQTGDIQLLLTDVVMPGMDGRQLAQRLGSTRPGLRVLFMSGYTADVIAQRGVLEQGMAFIGKPFSRDELGRRVHDLLAAAGGGAPGDGPGTVVTVEGGKSG
jgi:PAS domain S-box-containing protein